MDLAGASAAAAGATVSTAWQTALQGCDCRYACFLLLASTWPELLLIVQLVLSWILLAVLLGAARDKTHSLPTPLRKPQCHVNAAAHQFAPFSEHKADQEDGESRYCLAVEGLRGVVYIPPKLCELFQLAA